MVRRIRVYVDGPHARLLSATASPPSPTDAGAWALPALGRLLVFGAQMSRRVASELLSALARSSSASTSSLRMRYARPMRTAGSTPWSIQLRIVCAVTWKRPATSGTVSSCSRERDKAR